MPQPLLPEVAQLAVYLHDDDIQQGHDLPVDRIALLAGYRLL
jgi:hypothetical protein